MKLPSGWITVCAVMTTACATAPGIDRPVPLDAEYAVRETAAGKPADRCGPEFISDHLPQSLVSLMGPLIDGPFRPVCARHDACYELRAANGKRIDSEPGFGERSVRAGGSAVICVGTSGSPFWALNRIKGPVEIVLLADDPDSLALRHDRVAVDRRTVDRATLVVR